MKITVVGASGLIGTKVTELLKSQGHDVVASSRATGLDVLTGDGLADALAGAEALVDVTNSPSLEGTPALEFFTRVGHQHRGCGEGGRRGALRRAVDRRRRRAA